MKCVLMHSVNKNKKNTKKSKWLALLVPEILHIKVATLSECLNTRRFRHFHTSVKIFTKVVQLTYWHILIMEVVVSKNQLNGKCQQEGKITGSMPKWLQNDFKSVQILPGGPFSQVCSSKNKWHRGLKINLITYMYIYIKCICSQAIHLNGKKVIELQKWQNIQFCTAEIGRFTQKFTLKPNIFRSMAVSAFKFCLHFMYTLCIRQAFKFNTSVSI